MTSSANSCAAITQASNQMPMGYFQLTLAVLFLLATLAAGDTTPWRVGMSGVGCVVTVALTQWRKLSVRPLTTMATSGISIVLNSYAVGYYFPITVSLILSPLLALLISFASLPFKIHN